MEVLISFCNQHGERKENLMLLDLETGDRNYLAGNLSGFVGLFQDDKYFYALSQDPDEGLHIIDKITRKVLVRKSTPEVKDPHSVFANDKDIYIVSTGSDQLLRYSFDREKLDFEFVEPLWVPAGSEGKENTHHVNSVYKSGNSLFVSAFGPRKKGKAKSKSDKGYVFNVTEGKKVLSNIYHPHSLVVSNGDYYYCESARKKVLKNGKVILSLTEGYVRGLAVSDNHIVIGISNMRKVSKSTGLVNEGIDPKEQEEACKVVLFDQSKGEIVKKINLFPTHNEIYDIAVVSYKGDQKKKAREYSLKSTYGFDMYGRYALIRDVINANRESNEKLRILDVGGKGNAMKKFLPRDEVFYLDLQVDPNDSNSIKGNGCEMPLGNGDFDWVVSADVFEHIPAEKRKSFLEENMRVARLGVILAAPFYSEEVSKAERNINENYELLAGGKKHGWLQEHIATGLPREDEVKKFIASHNYSFQRICNNNLLLWQNLLGINMLALAGIYEGAKEEIKDFNYFYNSEVYPHDSRESAYRKVYFIKKDKKLKNLKLESEMDDSLYLEVIKKSLDLLARIDSGNKEVVKEREEEIQKVAKEVEKKEKVVQHKNQEIEKKEEIVQLKNWENKQKDKEIARRDEVIAQRSKIITQKDREITHKDESIKQRQEIINEKKEVFKHLNLIINHKERIIGQKNEVIDRIKNRSTRRLRFLKLDSSIISRVKGKYLKAKSADPHYIKNLLKQGKEVLYERGLKEFTATGFKYIVHGREYFKPRIGGSSDYDLWISKNEIWDPEKIKIQIVDFKYNPKISIITPVYNVSPRWLRKCVRSVQEQSYPNWELCLYDDASKNRKTTRCLKKIKRIDSRIKVRFGKKNKHISGASNEALKMATGEFVALLDNDDELSPNALFEVVKVLNKHPKADLIYSDEDKIDTENRRLEPFFKPDWSLDLLLSINYICHLGVYRRSIIKKIKGFRRGYEGSQDYDLVLRFIEKTNPKKIFHIPKILYHWRKIPGSVALAYQDEKNYALRTARRAIRGYLKRNNVSYTKVDNGYFPTSYRIKRKIPKDAKISIIIPFKDKLDLLKVCVKSVIKKTTYDNYEILLVDNQSSEEDMEKYLKKVSKSKKIRVLEYNKPFNFAAINNYAAKKAKGDYILFLNNDTEVISPDWLEEMLSHAVRKEVGAVGVRLLFPDKKIQHAGVILGMTGLAGHIFSGQYSHETYHKLGLAVRNYLAVTAACLMVDKDKFWKIGGFNEEFTVCGNDVDLCLNLYEKGLVNIYTPFAKLYHYEAASRDPMPPKCDIEISQKRYAPYLNGNDPYFNKNLSLEETVVRPKVEGSLLPEGEAPEEARDQDFQHKMGFIGGFSLSSREMKRNLDVINDPLNKKSKVKSINWFIPRFEHVLYGGIYTILRFAEYFQKKGVKNRIINFDDPTIDIEGLRVMVGKEFPALSKADFFKLPASKDLSDISSSDATISTFWPSCYISARFNRTKKKFYFVQDYEPLFYPAGSNYALSEATYRLGFSGIVNTPGLAEYVENQHGMNCQSFYPCVDDKVYYIKEPQLKAKFKEDSFNVFIYGRPNHDRNAFELGMASLIKLKEKYGDQVNIFSAGDDWDEKYYGVEGVINNLGRLSSLKEVADLYRKCDVGLVFMFTKHPSYQPFEFMACGCAVVTNVNRANTWLLRDKYNSMLAEPSPDHIVERISELVDDKRLREKIVLNGLAEVRKYNWDDECEKIYNYVNYGRKVNERD